MKMLFMLSFEANKKETSKAKIQISKKIRGNAKTTRKENEKQKKKINLFFFNFLKKQIQILFSFTMIKKI